ATWRRRCSMARKRASMREGPLAELFRATEAAQRQAEGQEAPQVEPVPEPELPPAAEEPVAVVEASRREPEPAPAPRAIVEEARPAARLVDPLPEQPPRLWQSPRADSAYLAVIRVVGVGGAGLNAIDRMIDAGITG